LQPYRPAARMEYARWQGSFLNFIFAAESQ
jgi:hypothetical protein